MKRDNVISIGVSFLLREIAADIRKVAAASPSESYALADRVDRIAKEVEDNG